MSMAGTPTSYTFKYFSGERHTHSMYVLLKYSMVQLANRLPVNVRPQIIEYEHRNR